VIDSAGNIGVHPVTLGDLVRTAQKRIAASGSDSPRLDAEVLLRHVIRADRVGLFMRLDEVASQGVADAFLELVEWRVAGQPVAYLTGVREFMGLSFHVTPEVLIPRPETELLVEWALDWIGQRSDLVVVDVGTGSGAIAVSIAALDTSGANRVIGSDISAEALRIAEGNAGRLLTPFRRPNISFARGSLLTWRQNPVDLVLANLPYLTPGQIAGNPDLDAEPRLALDGGNDGLDLVRSLIFNLPRVLAPHGAAGLEVDPEQVDAVIGLLRDAFPGEEVEVISDLAGHRRHVVMRCQTE
jgi:release factor glutamine methyltransferase